MPRLLQSNLLSSTSTFLSPLASALNPPKFQKFLSTYWHRLTTKAPASSLLKSSSSKPYILASFEERTFEDTPLLPGIGKVVLTHATLLAPLDTVQIIQYRSISVYSTSGERLYYVQTITARAEGIQGWNTIHGEDSGPPPPQLSTPLQSPQTADATMAQIMPNMPYRGHNTMHGYDAGPPPPYTASGFSMPQYPGMPGFIQPPAAVYQPPMPYMQPQPMMPGPGFPYNTTHPSMGALTNLGFPGIHLQNHLGGIGIPQGYNYIFPSEHTIIHVLKTATKPWQADQTIHGIDPSTHTKFYVPVEMNIKEFMKRIGCDDADDEKNVVYEVVEKGNRKWAVGMKVNMDDKEKMKGTLGKFGWNKQRNGNLTRGGRPIVWLWREKGE